MAPLITPHLALRAFLLEIFPILRFAFGQPLNRSSQSPLPRFIPLRVSYPVHVFFFVAVTEIFKCLSRFHIFLQRRFQTWRNVYPLFRTRSRTRFPNSGFI